MKTSSRSMLEEKDFVPTEISILCETEDELTTLWALFNLSKNVIDEERAKVCNNFKKRCIDSDVRFYNAWCEIDKVCMEAGMRRV